MHDQFRMGWRSTRVRGKKVCYSRGGVGPKVMFMHGWAVGPKTYRAPIESLIAMGCEVIAPEQPGFGGTAELYLNERDFSGYASWAADFLDAIGIDEPVIVIGHSFGGGVTIQLAHDFPERVKAAVVVNAVGGPVGNGRDQMRSAKDRPLWEWGKYVGSDLLALQSLFRVVPAVMEMAIPNIIQHPWSLWRVGEIVRSANLLSEANEVAEHGTPFTVVWSDRDHLIPDSGYAALASLPGVTSEMVPGYHNWLIADPARFADVAIRAVVRAGGFDNVVDAGTVASAC